MIGMYCIGLKYTNPAGAVIPDSTIACKLTIFGKCNQIQFLPVIDRMLHAVFILFKANLIACQYIHSSSLTYLLISVNAFDYVSLRQLCLRNLFKKASPAIIIVDITLAIALFFSDTLSFRITVKDIEAVGSIISFCLNSLFFRPLNYLLQQFLIFIVTDIINRLFIHPGKGQGVTLIILPQHGAMYTLRSFIINISPILQVRRGRI